MSHKTIISIVMIFLALPLTGAEPAKDYAKNWPQWRGPHATGIAPYGNPPLEWSENHNVGWKIEIPGKGSATPIIWGEDIFVLTAIPVDGGGIAGTQPTQELRFEVLAIRRKDGSIRWQQTARQERPHEGTHTDGTWASNSPVTDGEHLYAYFGSRGLFCYDLNGNLKWQKDFGDMQTRRGFGEGSSPALYGNFIVVNWDHEGSDFIVALDKRSGEEIWRSDRDEPTSWSTPLVVEHNGKAQVIVNATNFTRSYDLANGNIIWESSGMTTNTIPSPVVEDGVVYVTSGFRGNALQAIRLEDASGNITGSPSILWEYNRDTPYVPSPLVYNGVLYFLKSNDGILTSFNVKTGQPNYGPQRLEGIANIYASPVGADNRVYFAGREGATLVIKNGPEFTVLAQNSLDDGFDASPVIVDKELYLRGRKYLYRISEN